MNKLKNYKEAEKAKLLDSFWKLSELKQSTRVEGIKQLNNYISKQNDEDIDYILKRLIRGLASNRKCARLGFSCALTSLLNDNNNIKYSTIIDYAKSELKIDDNNSLNNEELRNIYIGNAFLYLSLIKNDGKNDELNDNLDQIMENLCKFRQQSTKTYIKQLYTQIIIEIIRRVDAKTFKKTILKYINEDLSNKWLNEDNLNLYLACLNTHKNVLGYQQVNDFDENTEKLYEFISKTTQYLPKLHPFCMELLNYMIKTENFTKFWSSLIDQRLCMRKEPEKKCLTFNLWFYLLDILNLDNYKRIVVNLNIKNMFTSFLNNYLKKQTNLHDFVRKMHKNLSDILERKDSELMKLSGNKSVIYDLIKQFMQIHGNYYEFADFLTLFIVNININGLKLLFDHFKMCLNDTVNGNDDELNLNKIWLLNQIATFSRNKYIFEADEGFLMDILKFLFLNSYFCDGILKSTNLDFVKEILLKFFGILLAKFDVKINKILFDLFQFVYDSLIVQKSIKLLSSTNGVNKKIDVKVGFTKLIKLMKDLFASQDKDEKHHLFFVLSTFQLVKLFDANLNVLNDIDDLKIAYEKSNLKLRDNNVNEDEPQWIDIVVEMVLSLYTMNNRCIRNTIKILFKKIIPLLTPESVKLLIDLLEPNSQQNLLAEDDDDVNEDEEEMKSDEDLNENGKSQINGNHKDDEEEAESEDESDDDDDDEDENDEDTNEIDENLIKAVDEALGTAKIQNSDDEDLDDDQMMKYDEALSAAFKMRTKDKQHEIDLMQYKFKILDLMQDLYKSTQRLDLIVYSIRPMLDILFESQKKSTLKLISQRILSFFIGLKNIKKFNDAKYPELDDVFQLLNDVILCSATHFNATNVLVEISIFCARLIQHIVANIEDKSKKSEIRNQLNEIYFAQIKNFYTSNDTKVNAAIHKEYLLRFPSLSLPLITKMIEFASNKDVKLHKKTLTLITLHQVINNQMFNDADKNLIESFMRKIFEFFDQLIDQIIEDENVHIKFVDALLNLIGRILNLQVHSINKTYVDNLIKKLELFNKEGKLKQAFKSRCANLINICKTKFSVDKDVHVGNGTNQQKRKSDDKIVEVKSKKAKNNLVNGDKADNNGIDANQESKKKLKKKKI